MTDLLRGIIPGIIFTLEKYVVKMDIILNQCFEEQNLCSLFA